jgi:hypothetical protein
VTDEAPLVSSGDDPWEAVVKLQNALQLAQNERDALAEQLARLQKEFARAKKRGVLF